MPAEVPNRCLRIGGRRLADFCEQNVHFARLQGRKARESRFRCAGKLLRIKINCGVRVHRIEMKVMKPRRRQRIGFAICLSIARGREYRGKNGSQKENTDFQSVTIFSIRAKLSSSIQ